MLYVQNQEKIKTVAHTINSNSLKSMQTQSRYHRTEEQLKTENDHVMAAKKNPARFEYLYNKYYEQIFRYVYQRVDDKESAFDVTSQVFLKAMSNLHKYEYRGVPFASWLYRIAKSEVYQSFKNKSSRRTINVESIQVFEIIE